MSLTMCFRSNTMWAIQKDKKQKISLEIFWFETVFDQKTLFLHFFQFSAVENVNLATVGYGYV